MKQKKTKGLLSESKAQEKSTKQMPANDQVQTQASLHIGVHNNKNTTQSHQGAYSSIEKQSSKSNKGLNGSRQPMRVIKKEDIVMSPLKKNEASPNVNDAFDAMRSEVNKSNSQKWISGDYDYSSSFNLVKAGS